MYRWLIVLLLAGCDCGDCYPTDYQNITDRRVNPSTETGFGIPVDLHGVRENVDLDKIDTVVLEVKGCVERMGFDVDLSCLQIGVVGDWFWSHDGRWQLFECDMPRSVCDAKVEAGVLPDLDFPCSCRSAIQDNDTVVIPPNLGLLRSELVRLFTGINNVWIAELADCVQHELPE